MKVLFASESTLLATCATAGFTAAVVAGAWMTVSDWGAALPLLAFHALFLIHSYFSVWCFASAAPHPSVAQIVVDGVLVALYVFLPFQFADPTRYLIASTALFLVAIVKYAILLGTPGWTALLKGKMTLDLLAALTCGLALAGVMAGVPHTLELWLGVFLIAHIYILAVRRFYVPVVDPALALSNAPDHAAQ